MVAIIIYVPINVFMVFERALFVGYIPTSVHYDANFEKISLKLQN